MTEGLWLRVESGVMMFQDLERFVAVHRPCGAMTSDVGDATETSYRIALMCCRGAGFERWVTPEMADHDLLRSRLLAFPS